MSRPARRLIAVVAAVAVAAYFAACLGFSLRAAAALAQGGDDSAGRTLPAGFLLGTATSAHQVEGGNTRNDWFRFEAQPGRIARGERSGRAADDWARVDEDVALMSRLGATAYRFSIEWSRLEPVEGTWDDSAWAHYEHELDTLRAAGVVPMVTLLHFTLPQWLADRGGAAAPDFPRRFAIFAAEAARRLGPGVGLWCTVNEPNVQMVLGYLDGRWPPGVRDPKDGARAFVGLLRAHAAAATEIRVALPRAKIGVAANLVDFQPRSRWNLLDWVATALSARAYDWSFYDAIRTGRAKLQVPGLFAVDEAIPGLRGSADYFGMNYYTRFLIHFAPRAPGMIEQRPGPGPRTDMDWEIYPDGLFHLLRAAWRRYHLPIYVTENGIADDRGDRRAAYIDGHLRAVAAAIADGVPVRGYFYWSLMDNFEWAEGFRPRFGLYHVDYATMARTLAPGAEAFTRWAGRVSKK